MSEKNVLTELLDARMEKDDKSHKTHGDDNGSLDKNQFEIIVHSEEKKKSNSCKKKKSNDSDGKFEKLGELMKDGFVEMSRAMGDMGTSIAQKISEELKPMFNYNPHMDEGNLDACSDESEDQEDSNIDNDIIASISKDFAGTEVQGPPLSPTLAKLVDTMLSTRADAEIKSACDLRNPKPSNVKFVECPQVNKQVWSCMKRNARLNDLKLQKIQQEYIKGAIPIAKVIDQLHVMQSKPEELNVRELIKTLSDSLTFIGAANLEMVKTRREHIKEEVPPKLRSLCNPEMEFSGASLFGDNLVQTLKEVSETQKFSEEMFRDRQSTRVNARYHPYRSYYRRGFNTRISRGSHAPVNRGSFLYRGRMQQRRSRGTSGRSRRN